MSDGYIHKRGIFTSIVEDRSDNRTGKLRREGNSRGQLHVLTKFQIYGSPLV